MSEIKQGLCRRMDDDGNGIVDKIPFPNVLPLEEIQYHPKTKKLIKRLSDAPTRVNVPCPYFNICGSCQFLHWEYDAQLEWKTEQVRELFSPISKEPVQDCLGTSLNFGYRSKNILTFKAEGKTVMGGYYAGKTHKLFDVKSCDVAHPKAMAIFSTLKTLVKDFKVEIYDEDKRKGLLRHALIRIGARSDEILLVLVVAHSEFKGRKNFVNALIAKHPEITTIIENQNSRSTSIVLGTQERTLYGKGYIIDQLGEYTFKISSRSFFQVHPTQTQVLYDLAISCANLKKTDVLVDAYSGVGTIGIYASKHVGQVICVESNKDATEDARANGKHNKTTNVKFVCADAAQWLLDASTSQVKIDVVILDPPREGSDKNFLFALRKLQPRTIIYISCNPETQVRDLKELMTLYNIKQIQPVDMFPHTSHIETCVLLSHKNS